MKTPQERLVELLPAIYRIRDAEQGGPLDQYFSVLAEQLAALEEDAEQLYDDLFIETCAEWVVPYIGDLVGNRTLHGVAPKTISRRAEVANTIAYRRRKGTACMLEQLARDVTGWNARVVEFFELLGWTQYTNHVRPDAAYAPNQRSWEPLERLGTAFDTSAHTVSVRRIATEKGRFNVPNIGIFLWRLGAYPLTESPAFKVDSRRYMFSPLGNDAHLFNLPQTEESITHVAGPLNVPEPISRRVLDARLENYYGEGLSLLVSDGSGPIDPADVSVCDLSDAGGGSWAHVPPDKIAIDPVLGRIAFPTASGTRKVKVSYHWGFSANMGGGEYERRASIDGSLEPVTGVAMGSTLQDAIDDRSTGGAVEIEDSGRYPETLVIEVDAGQKIEMRSVNENRATVVLGGDFEIKGGADSVVSLDGLLITGGTIRVPSAAANKLGRLRISHCTLVPGIELGRDGSPNQPDQPSLIVEAADVVVEITDSIVGGLRIGVGSRVFVKDSIVDATDMSGVAYAHPDGESAGGELSIEESTVIGKIHSKLLRLVSNSILWAGLADNGETWTAPVRSTRKQEGCLRFSSIPEGSRVPRRYRCQPDLAVREAVEAAMKRNQNLSAEARAHLAAGVQLRMQPVFTDLRYGRPAYAQLGISCPNEIRRGADDESEMGAFHHLFQPQRESDLQTRLDEYLRFGLEAGVFFAS